LDRLGIVIDGGRNRETVRRLGEISMPGSDVKVLVIPTNEELKIARETMKLLESKG
jgi:acetate kinase